MSQLASLKAKWFRDELVVVVVQFRGWEHTHENSMKTIRKPEDLSLFGMTSSAFSRLNNGDLSSTPTWDSTRVSLFGRWFWYNLWFQLSINFELWKWYVETHLSSRESKRFVELKPPVAARPCELKCRTSPLESMLWNGRCLSPRISWCHEQKLWNLDFCEASC